MKSRVLVTGASGFIGRHLVAALMREADVHVVSARAGRAVPGTHRHRVDLRRAAPTALLGEIRPRVIYHLAAPTESHVALPDRAYYESIVIATSHLLEAARDAGVARVVLAGSAKEYGDTARAGARLRESDLPRPLTPYAVAKLTCTHMAGMYHRRDALAVTTLRLFPVFGPGMPEQSLIMRAMRAAATGRDLPMTPGRQTRDLLFVDDAVRAFQAAGAAAVPYAGVLNVCTGRAVTVQQAARRVFELVGTRARLRPGALPYPPFEIRHLCGDPSAARRRLGWRARVALDDGLRRTLQALAA